MRLRIVCLALVLVFSCLFVTGQEREDAKQRFYAPYYSDGEYTGPLVDYVIKKGDTLKEIALNQLGDSSLSGLIAMVNGINDEHRIYAGQKIKVPAPRIGMNYSIQLLVGKGDDCDLETVSPYYDFRSGDKFRLRLAGNHNGYLYIFSKDDKGVVSKLFPDDRINRGRNRVNKYTAYQIPPEGWLKFDDQPGKEDVLIIYSLSRIDELEEILASEEGVLMDKEWQRINRMFKELKGVEAEDVKDGDSFMLQTRKEGINAIAVHFAMNHGR